MSNYNKQAGHPIRFKFNIKARCQVLDRDGNIEREFDADGSLHLDGNGFVNVGLNDILDKFWKGSSYTAAHYMGLVDDDGFSAFAAADTMSSHVDWAESTEYDEAARVTITWGTVSGQSVTSGNVDFSINATTTIHGIFVTTVSTKGGTTGTLIGTVAFDSPQALVDGNTLRVILTSTAAAA
jgi:hypothetical protein